MRQQLWYFKQTSSFAPVQLAVGYAMWRPGQSGFMCNSLSVPKLLYTSRTAECSGRAALLQFDNILREGLSAILNIHLTDDQWIQASLPVRNGGLGIRSATMLAPSALLASATGKLWSMDSVISNFGYYVGTISCLQLQLPWTSRTQYFDHDQWLHFRQALKYGQLYQQLYWLQELQRRKQHHWRRTNTRTFRQHICSCPSRLKLSVVSTKLV